MWRIMLTGLTILLLASGTILGACGPSEGPAAPPPPPSYEAPPIDQMLAVGEATTVGGVKFTVLEFLPLAEIKGEVPLESDYQYLLVHFEVENTTAAALPPPYLDENILIIHQGKASGIPSLIFTPTVPLADGGTANHYTYRSHFSGELEANQVHDGWECYLVPLEFTASDAFVKVTFGTGEQVFWGLGKS